MRPSLCAVEHCRYRSPLVSTHAVAVWLCGAQDATVRTPLATTAEWKAGTLPAGYRPSQGSVTVAAWTEGNRMAVGFVDVYGGVIFQVNSAQTDGTNQGSLSYPIF